MKRSIGMALCLTAFFGVPLQAAEGMWPPGQIPEVAAELERAGLKLEPRSMTRLTDFPMGAIISLGGCTASFVSAAGLVMTNHHCAFGSIQYNSTEEDNLLQDGFLARSRDDERPAAPGTRVYVAVAERDVTGPMTEGLDPDLDPGDLHREIEAREKRLLAKCEVDPGHRCRIRSFHGGLEYRLVKRLEIRDVRLVYAPPSSVGRFGGEIDNWMWPRHTGDFAFYRAYVGPDGRPADAADENVPYAPRHHLPVAARGVSEDDFVMVMGYPGRTHRYRLVSEVERRFEWYYPTRKALFEELRREIERAVEGRPEAELKYETYLAGLSNAIKNYQGMIDGYESSGMFERRRQREEALERWIAAEPERRRRHGAAIRDLAELVRRDRARAEREMVLGMLERSTMLTAARRLYRLAVEQDKPDAERRQGYQQRDRKLFAQRLARIDRRYDPQVDRAILSLALEHVRELPEDARLASLDRELRGPDGRWRDDTDAWLARLYEGTRLDEKEVREAWIGANRARIDASDDPFLKLAGALYPDDAERERETDRLEGESLRVRPRYMAALIDFERSAGRAVYPDANGGLRVTWGHVRGYSPRDGVWYRPFTKLGGLLEKYTGEDPFDAPAAALEAIRERRHGGHAEPKLDSVPVNYLSTVDTTGGNSGSPTVNARGELVGLLFDGTYESINADWQFDSNNARSIHVDVRFLLWYLEVIDEAGELLDELGVPAHPSRRG